MYSEVLKRIQQKIKRGMFQLTQHAIKELNDDDFFVEDIERGILSGRISERQKDLVTGEWKYVIMGNSTQENKKIGVVVKEKKNVIIITVFWEI
ncbi:MAG: DUF4258 domain-containing protein [SAR324 cluster bacterium]|nr:DUF4258 domain-containing protein [SAR324 cluster bacterium]